MKERPILFSAPMVRALLAGTKTQTRRIVKPQPAPHESWDWSWPILRPGVTPGTRICWRDDSKPNLYPYCPYGVPGDRLWVRESFTTRNEGSRAAPRLVPMYAADFEGFNKPDRDWDWAPSIHMPRWASRLTLEIAEVRVERLQDISEADSEAEGVTPKWSDGVPILHDGTGGICREGYRELWETINGPGSWDANPWVWAVIFKRVAP